MKSLTAKTIKKARDNAEYLRLYAATLLDYEDNPAELRKRQRAMHELAHEIVLFLDHVEPTNKR